MVTLFSSVCEAVVMLVKLLSWLIWLIAMATLAGGRPTGRRGCGMTINGNSDKPEGMETEKDNWTILKSADDSSLLGNQSWTWLFSSVRWCDLSDRKSKTWLCISGKIQARLMPRIFMVNCGMFFSWECYWFQDWTLTQTLKQCLKRVINICFVRLLLWQDLSFCRSVIESVWSLSWVRVGSA